GENRLVSVDSGQFTVSSIEYNGLGDRVVQSTAGMTTTVYLGSYFEWAVGEAPTATMKSYYYAGLSIRGRKWFFRKFCERPMIRTTNVGFSPQVWVYARCFHPKCAISWESML
ncbi:MAG: hypothetical protein JXA78_13335, partial [Anaerolineales bacterium]|nr:hypothetical protein [Anaerolineales bacterium]